MDNSQYETAIKSALGEHFGGGVSVSISKGNDRTYKLGIQINDISNPSHAVPRVSKADGKLRDVVVDGFQRNIEPSEIYYSYEADSLETLAEVLNETLGLEIDTPANSPSDPSVDRAIASRGAGQNF